jgi:hypothetical protein
MLLNPFAVAIKFGVSYGNHRSSYALPKSDGYKESRTLVRLSINRQLPTPPAPNANAYAWSLDANGGPIMVIVMAAASPIMSKGLPMNDHAASTTLAPTAT